MSLSAPGRFVFKGTLYGVGLVPMVGSNPTWAKLALREAADLALLTALDEAQRGVAAIRAEVGWV